LLIDKIVAIALLEQEGVIELVPATTKGALYRYRDTKDV